MKKLIIVMGLSVMLMTACVSVDTQNPETNQSKETVKVTNSIQSIEQAMEDHSYPKETIVHYELKAPFVFVFTTSTNGLAVSVLKETEDAFEWLDHYDAVENMSILHAEEEMPVLTVVKETGGDTTDVTVQGEYTKMIRFVSTEVDDYVSYTRFWVHFADWDPSYTEFEALPVHSVKKITE